MLQRIRPLLFWVHLVVGVATSCFLVLLCLTGTLLAFELPVVGWMEHGLVEAHEGGTIPSVEALLPRIEAAEGRVPERIVIASDPGVPAVARFGRRDQVRFDPWTGASLGEGAASTRAFFHTVMTVHRWLALEGAPRDVARAVIGGVTLLFGILLVTGPLLWLPRTWRWARFRSVLFFRRGLAGAARDLNWHNVLGIWALVPLFVLALTGAAIAYPWLNQGLVQLAGGTVESRERPAPAPSPSEGREQGLDAVVAAVAAAEPGWQTVSVALPPGPKDLVEVTVDHGNGRQPHLRRELVVQREPMSIVSSQGWEQASRSQQVRGVIRFGHTGELLGLPGQLLAALASLAGAVLALTGLSLSLRRFSRWRSRARGSAHPA